MRGWFGFRLSFEKSLQTGVTESPDLGERRFPRFAFCGGIGLSVEEKFRHAGISEIERSRIAQG